MRYSIPFITLMAITIGCAANNPVVPATGDVPPLEKQNMSSAYDGNYRLWGEFSFFIDAEHDKVDVVPRREARFHLNALKFLEESGKNFIKITGIKNNGDGTVDLSVQITHPFKGYPQFTGFDVKGIIMFNGSWEVQGDDDRPPYPEPFRVSWRKLGDPQVLNADGYTLRWSPSYDSGLPQPIFNYWKGKWANGTPTANLNAYKNFYTDENRHMFRDYGQVTQTYTIWLPQGQPIIAGYAVEACWEPPSKIPVTDPANDFPLTANQPEAYKFYANVNNGEPITDTECCGEHCDPSKGYWSSKQWGGHTALHFSTFSDYYKQYGAVFSSCGGGWYTGTPCPSDEWPDQYCGQVLIASKFTNNGDYIGVVENYKMCIPLSYGEISYSVFEFTIDF